MAENSDDQSSVSNLSSANASADVPKQPQVPSFPYFPPLQHGNVNMLPIMYPGLVPGVVSAQNMEQMHGGPGIYAVPVLSIMGTVTRIPTNVLIPLTYSTPTRTTLSEPGQGGAEQNQGDQQQLQQLPRQRQVVGRRFQIAFQLDFLLIIKLVAVIFIFNHDGSRQRFVLLVFLAAIKYLYKTGALTPVMRWISQAMHRAAAPPRPPRPAVRAEPIPRLGNENIIAAAADVEPGAGDVNQPTEAADHIGENEAPPEAAIEGANQWWGIVKEIQMIIFGFLTSLLPGFHNMDHP